MQSCPWASCTLPFTVHREGVVWIECTVEIDPKKLGPVPTSNISLIFLYNSKKRKVGAQLNTKWQARVNIFYWDGPLYWTWGIDWGQQSFSLYSKKMQKTSGGLSPHSSQRESAVHILNLKIYFEKYWITQQESSLRASQNQFFFL
jgi:hypothetical protein